MRIGSPPWPSQWKSCKEKIEGLYLRNAISRSELGWSTALSKDWTSDVGAEWTSETIFCDALPNYRTPGNAVFRSQKQKTCAQQAIFKICGEASWSIQPQLNRKLSWATSFESTRYLAQDNTRREFLRKPYQTKSSVTLALESIAFHLNRWLHRSIPVVRRFLSCPDWLWIFSIWGLCRILKDWIWY